MTKDVPLEAFARPARQPDRPIAGCDSVICVGTNIPEELISAHGLIPCYLTGEVLDETPQADSYLEDKYTSEFRSIMQQLLEGAANPARLIIFDRRFRDIFYYVKEMIRLGLVSDFPPVHLFDLILSRSVQQTAFNLQQVRLLDDAIQQVADERTAESLWSVIGAANTWREQVRHLLVHRKAERISGVGAFNVLSAVRWLGRTEHGRRLAGLNDTLAASPLSAGSSSPTVLVASGESLYHDRLHRAVEATGARVLGEDSEWGSRVAGADIADASDSALVDKYWADATGSELRPFPARAAWLIEAVGEYHPDVVVLWVPPGDTTFGWDIPRLIGRVRAAGAEPVLFRGDVLSDTSFDAAASELDRVFAGTVGVAR
jgi:benzoyl-CoA reductase/2-hydroxyglutaryl-CoA dehydratase subunit BcrC/BadD/HgdB